MIEAVDLVSLGGLLWHWQAYDPAVKADLSSGAAQCGDRLFLIDPIPLDPPALAKLTAHRTIGGVLVTNSNHPRASAALARQLGATIFASEPAIHEFVDAKTQPIAAGEIMPGLAAITIEGAASGEMAFHFADSGGTLVVGDALINFEPYGFTMLPAKYCSNQKQMRRSLRQLLDSPFERLLFAHGSPILSSARARLDTLLR